MSQDDVERVARAILRVRVQGFNLGWDDSGGRSVIEYGREMARAAFSAMPPRDELLREALEALQGLHDDVVEYVTLNKLHDADGSPAINNHWMRRARAAADKIRAALEHQQKETP